MCSNDCSVRLKSFKQIADFDDAHKNIELLIVKFPGGYETAFGNLIEQYSKISYSPINDYYGLLMFYNNENDYRVTDCSLLTYTYLNRYIKFTKTK